MPFTDDSPHRFSLLIFNLSFNFRWLKVKSSYLSHFNEKNTVNILVKNTKGVTLEVHYNETTLKALFTILAIGGVKIFKSLVKNI